MFELYVGIVASGFRHNRAPQFRGFQNVGFVHRQKVLPARTGQFKSANGNAADFLFVIDHGIDARAQAVFVFGNPPGFPEIDISGQFPQDHDVNALHQIFFKRRSIYQFVKDHDRSQIGIKPELFA